MKNTVLLENAILNQIDLDSQNGDFTAISECLAKLLENKENEKIFIGFLDDNQKELLTLGKTKTRY